MKKLQEGWNERENTALCILVEDGKVKRGTYGEGVTLRPAYMYTWSKNENAYTKINELSVKEYLKLEKEEKISWV